MKLIRALSLSFLAVLLSSVAIAQQKPSSPVAAKSAPSQTSPPKPKLTDKQKQGLRLLNSALTEAAALQPEMRAYIEWQVAMGYEKYDVKKSDDLLQSAFISTTEISSTLSGRDCWRDDVCRHKVSLQREIVQVIIKHSPEKATAMILKVDPPTKRGIDELLLDTYIEKKQLDQAKEILDSVSGEDYFPFYQASAWMEALPESRKQERVTVFSQALSNFEQFNTDQLPRGDYDFPSMLVRFWRQLPPALAMNAVDAILKKTKEDDSDTSKLPMTIMTSNSGNINFTSGYELRLFELMPILRELDSSRAESLLRESAEVKAVLKDYPNGVSSIDKDFGKLASKDDDAFPAIINFGPSFDAADDQEQAYLFQQQGRIDAEARRDPKRALADAIGLPELTPSGHHPRLGALSVIAEKTVRKDPQVCRAALSELRKMDLSQRPDLAVDILLQVADYYIQLGDSKSAVDAVREALKMVDELYRKDSDADDPNLAFKVNWPSTQYWGRCLHMVAAISPRMVDEILGEIQDPEVMSFEKVMYANGLLGASRSGMDVAERHKNGQSTYYRSQ